MPFDPTKPANNSPLSSAEMRSQLTGLKSQIDNAVANSSTNSNGVDFFMGGFSDPATGAECQSLADKLNELIGALRR